ncbi:MAG: hypothetical protein AVDCRST_MAG73-2008, partial [uncultured Thermomicrobiales bacterium]
VHLPLPPLRLPRPRHRPPDLDPGPVGGRTQAPEAVAKRLLRSPDLPRGRHRRDPDHAGRRARAPPPGRADALHAARQLHHLPAGGAPLAAPPCPGAPRSPRPRRRQRRSARGAAGGPGVGTGVGVV